MNVSFVCLAPKRLAQGSFGSKCLAENHLVIAVGPVVADACLFFVAILGIKLACQSEIVRSRRVHDQDALPLVFEVLFGLFDERCPEAFALMSGRTASASMFQVPSAKSYGTV